MGKIEPIEEVERRREIRNIGKCLFKSQDPRAMIFKPEVEACLMFYPPDPDDLDYLTKDQYEAIISAAKLMGDTGFVLSDHSGSLVDDPNYRCRVTSPEFEYKGFPPGPDDWIEVPCEELAKHWWCEYPTYEDYRTIESVGLFDIALFSIDARWGLLTGHEWHTLVGGNIDFIGHVDKMYPAWRNEVMELIDVWGEQMVKGVPEVDLLFELLEYWRRYPADEWVKEVTEKLNRKLHGSF